MGLLYKIKKFFGRTIDLENKDEVRLVSMAKKSGNIPLNSILSVKQNFAAVIVVKDKISDVFFEGQYKLTPTSLPVTNRLLNLSRVKKNGGNIKRFKGYVYYVNLNQFDMVNYFCESPLFVKSKNFLGVDVKIGGNFGFKIFDAVSFLGALFTQYAFLRGDLALEQLKIWVGQNANKKIEKNKPTVEEINERDNKCFVGLVDYLNARLSSIGVRISAFEVTKTVLPKNIYKKVKLSFKEMSEKANESKEQALKNSAPISSKIENVSVVEQIKKEPAPVLINQPLSNNQESSKDSVLENDIYVDEKNELMEPQVVKKTIQFKTCSNCGALNTTTAKICFNCGKSFGKICPKCGKEVDIGDFVCKNCKTIIIK